LLEAWYKLGRKQPMTESIEALVAITAGVLASASFIVNRKPEAQDIIEKLVPYQGFIGLLVLFWSIRGVLRLDFWPMEIAMTVAQFIVGFLLSYGLLSKYLLNRSDEAKERGLEVRSKLSQYQVPAGLALIALGLWNLFF